MGTGKIVGVGLALGLATAAVVQAENGPLTFADDTALKSFTVSGDVSVDLGKDRAGAKDVDGKGTQETVLNQGGALRLGAGSKAVWPLRDTDGTGKVEMWVFEDAATPAKPKEPGAGAMWGLQQADGHMVAVGALYAPYLSGATTYAACHLDPEKRKPHQAVTYLGIRRAPGWHKWTFDFDPDKGMRLLCDDADVKLFNWNQSQLNGFSRIVLFGDTTDAKQTLWVDDITVTLGPPTRVHPVWPPPPPPPPADLAVLPPQRPWDPTPYASWKNGPGQSEDYFPIAVWLQNPKNAARYKAAGINLYLGLWKGPTEEQLAELKQAGMRVICERNDVGMAHQDDPTIAGWLQPDEPDNAQSFKDYWKEDLTKLKDGWPGLFDSLGPDKPYRGYGPPIPPAWIVGGYEAARTADPSRPVFLGLGQGVAWNAWHGRGERTGKLEDYPAYMRGCDIVGFDIYPAAESNLAVRGALWYVASGVRRLREWSKDAMPVWVHLETGIIGAPDARPTPKQVKAEIWMALIHGARGIDYFVHQFKPSFNDHALLDNADMLAMVTAENRRITELAPVLNRPTIADGIAVESTNPRTPVHAMVKDKGGITYVFGVAMYGDDTNATFRVKGLAGKRAAEVIGEDRTIPVADGVFTDAFAGHGVHLYRIP